MKRGLLLIVMVVVTLFTPSPLYAAERVYVKLPGTYLLTEPSRSAPRVVSLAEGEQLTVLQNIGKFYQVRTDKDKTGYVQRFRVSGKPPGPTPDDKNDLDKLIGALEDAPRTAAMNAPRSGHSIRGRTRSPQKSDSVSHSIRGLDREEGAAQGASHPEATASLQRLEEQKVNPAALDAFQRSGEVGPYAH